MALRLGPFVIPWPRRESHDSDPYWERFIGTAPADLDNWVPELIRRAPEGNVFPTRAELHTPEITASHVKDLARYLGTDLVGIGKLEANDDYPFAIICAVRAPYDPRKNRGIGGQVPVQNGLFITFVLSAWIRELGYRATAAADPDAERLAAAAGLGTLGDDGRLWTRDYGSVHVASVIRTDLPLVPD